MQGSAFQWRALSRASSLALLYAGVALPSAAIAQTVTAEFQGLGFIGGGGVNPLSQPYGISADGSVIVGGGRNASGRYEAFRWTGGVMTGLGFIDGGGTSPQSQATAVSADGSTVVGNSTNADNQDEAFRWFGGVMTGLGFIDGGGTSPQSQAEAMSANGLVVVGNSKNANNQFEAYRWSGGVMTGLGFIDGGGTSPYSNANGVSADGSVVVGFGTNANDQTEAFRWSGGVMTGLGFVDSGIPNPYSRTVGMSADGSVVIGDSRNASYQDEAFRWSGGVMTGLGFIDGGGANPSSNASAVSTDGSVVVGYSKNANSQTEAFRWSGGAITGLGFIDGGGTGPASNAYAVNADGSIVVGYSHNASNLDEAFRWTAETGMRSLGGLLSDAGVDMTGWRLTNGYRISPDGQFIAGNSYDPNGHNQAYMARYAVLPLSPTNPTGPVSPPVVIAGMTTGTSVQNSIEQVMEARQGVGLHQHGFAAPLLGDTQAIGSGNELGLFGMAGSAAGGAFSRWAFGNGFSVTGGVSWMQEAYQNAEVENAVFAAGSLRYVMPSAGIRPFGEVGGWVAPDASLNFSRDYANGAGSARATGSTGGTLSYVYGRAGIAFNLTSVDEIALSGEWGYEQLRTDAYAETLSPSNPFEASFSDGRLSQGVAKLRGQWTHAFSDRIDTTFWLAAATTYAEKDNLQAGVAGFGLIQTDKPGHAQWLEYGARVGLKLTQSVTVDAFASGTSGNNDLGTRVHAGLDIRTSF